MRLHKEGYKVVITTFIILWVLVLLGNFLFPQAPTFHALLYIMCALLMIKVLFFFRAPKRVISLNENNILAPADGKIVVIEKIKDDEFIVGEYQQVSIFMSMLNAHVNWVPVSGIVRYTKHHHGKYLVAWHPKSSKENERTTVVLDNEKGKLIKIRQIAGLVARRIVCYAKENGHVIQGKELGFIKFGSRVDILLPLEANIKVQINEKVVGGKTVIAEL